MKTEALEQLNRDFQDKTAAEVVAYAVEHFGVHKVTLASSLSIEDQVLTDLLMKRTKEGRIFVLDTGRHFEETYDVMQKTMGHYGFQYEIYAPNTQVLQEAVAKKGPNFFYESVDERKRCCYIRKVEPLERALSGVDAWICGLRRDQATTRGNVALFEWDEAHGIVKVNPLANWSEEDVFDYIKEQGVVYSKLYGKGYRSIGCEPCTRPVAAGEDLRSGRWWWESPDKKECGLHARWEESK